MAIDAERASGYRYTARAYLVQLRREGAGTALIDPIPFDDLSTLQAALDGTEWILHAASQDLPCLTELGLRPAALFDTELAGRLLGYPRVGLATLVETILGRSMRKEHSAVDWSTRPLPEPWLEYAALDVEVLIELRDALGAGARGDRQGRVGAPGVRAPRSTPRRAAPSPTPGVVRRDCTGSAAAAPWPPYARSGRPATTIAQQRDVTPGRIIPDSAIVEAANALPKDRATLLGAPGLPRPWRRALRQPVARRARRRRGPCAEDELPLLAARYDGPPPPRTWADKDPVAAARLSHARVGDEQAVARSTTSRPRTSCPPTWCAASLWEPPEGDDSQVRSPSAAALGARPWQVELTAAAAHRGSSSAQPKVRQGVGVSVGSGGSKIELGLLVRQLQQLVERRRLLAGHVDAASVEHLFEHGVGRGAGCRPVHGVRRRRGRRAPSANAATFCGQPARLEELR